MVIYIGKFIIKEAAAKKTFASNSCGPPQIILLQQGGEKLLLKVPVPRNKIYKDNAPGQVSEHPLGFAVCVAKR